MRFLVASAALLYGALHAFTSAAQTAGELAPEPHIALLLPLGAGPFVAHAQAVRDGFIAAAERDGAPLPLRIYAATDEAEVTLSGYRQAVTAGARIVVGPLTRNAVSALAGTRVIPVPTLALNTPDGATALPPRFYTLSLQIETEARLIARVAFEEGRRRAYTVAGTDALSKRMNDAFVEEFQRLGGELADGQIYGGDRESLERYRAGIEAAKADAIFLALDAERGRTIKPFLGTTAVYATSQIYPGSADTLARFELDDVRFVGMPWMLQADHAAVMIYPRKDYGGDPDLQRLYALGIDAYRAGRLLLDGQATFTLDGVTGALTVVEGRIQRGLPVARLVNGVVTVSGVARP